MSWKDDMVAMGAKRRVRAPGAAKPPKTTDQVASTNSSGSTSAFDLKRAADNAREYMQYRSISRPSAADPNTANQLPAKAASVAQTAPVRVTAEPVASEAISEQKSTSDADAELIARAERVREKLWHAGKQKGAQQKALQEQMKQIEAEAAQTAKQEALAKAEAAQKAVEELLAEEEKATHQAAARKAKKDRRKAKKQQQQEEEQLQRRQQQEEELLQRQQQQEEEQQRVQKEMRHQQQLQEEQELQQQKQAKQQAQKLQQQKLQEQLQGQVLQQKLQPQVQEPHEDQTQQEQQQQQQKQQRSVEQPPLQVHTQRTGYAAGGSSTGTAANTVSASKNSAAEKTEPLLSPELMYVKQSSCLARQTAKPVRLDHAEPSQCVIGHHRGEVPNVDHWPATRQQKCFAAPHHLLCCPITQVCSFLSYDLIVKTLECRQRCHASSVAYVRAVFAFGLSLRDGLS